MDFETFDYFEPFETSGVATFMTKNTPEVNFAVIASGDKHNLENFSQYKLRRAISVMAHKDAVNVRRQAADQHDEHDPLAENDVI